MSLINTVLGPIAPDKLGPTLAHEHIVLGYCGWECDAFSLPYDREKIVKICVEMLKPVKQYGLKSIIDATPIDLGRDVEVMKEVSEKSGINIICSTGMYTEEQGEWAYYRQRYRLKTGDPTAEMRDTYLKELTQGIGTTGVKAGVIKVATGHSKISELEMTSLKAAARAQKETGAPIITHTEGGTMGPEQMDALISEGANPAKIMCGHMCGSGLVEYQLAVIGKGVNIAFDRFGIETIMPDAVRTATLIGLLGLGFADRILLSHDFIAYKMGREQILPENIRQLVANWSYAHVFRNIIPALKRAGVTDNQINMMMVENPRRLLS